MRFRFFFPATVMKESGRKTQISYALWLQKNTQHRTKIHEAYKRQSIYILISLPSLLHKHVEVTVNSTQYKVSLKRTWKKPPNFCPPMVIEADRLIDARVGWSTTIVWLNSSVEEVAVSNDVMTWGSKKLKFYSAKHVVCLMWHDMNLGVIFCL